MPDQDIFDENNNSTPSGDPAPSSPNDIFADKLKTIVNDKGEPKYNSVEQALEALAHSQQFIETLKSEKSETERKLQEFENELKTRESVEDVVKRLTDNKAQPQTPKVDQPGKEDGFNEDKVMELVNSVLSQNQQAQQQSNNLDTVVKSLSDVYGDKTREVVANRAKELNTTPKQIQEMAMSNPQLVLSLFKDVKVDNSAPAKPSSISVTPVKESNELPKSDKKLITGVASNEEVMSVWNSAKEHTYKQLGVET